MFKFIDWFVTNWQGITVILGFILILSLVKPGANLIRGAKDGIREILTPAGFLVFLVLIALAIYLFTYFKGIF